MATPWVGRCVRKAPCQQVLGNCAQMYCCGMKGITWLVKKEGQNILLRSEGVSMAMCLGSGSNLNSEMQTLQRHQASFVIADVRIVIGDTLSEGLAGGLLLGKTINTLLAVRQKILTAELMGKRG